MVVEAILPSVDRHQTFANIRNINSNYINLVGKKADSVLDLYDIETNYNNVVAKYNKIRRGVDSSVGEFSLLNGGLNGGYRIRGRKVIDRRKFGAGAIRRNLYGVRNLYLPNEILKITLSSIITT